MALSPAPTASPTNHVGKRSQEKLMTTLQVKDARSPFAMIEYKIMTVYGKRLGAYGIAVYNMLVMFSGSKSEAWPSIDSLAEMIGVSRPTIIKAIDKLVELGIITKENRFDDKGQTTNLYTLIDSREWVNVVDSPPSTTFTHPRKPRLHEQDGSDPRSSDVLKNEYTNESDNDLKSKSKVAPQQKAATLDDDKTENFSSEAQQEAQPQEPSAYNQILRMYHREVGKLSDSIEDGLQHLCTQYTPEIVLSALKTAIQNNNRGSKPSMNYIRKIAESLYEEDRQSQIRRALINQEKPVIQGGYMLVIDTDTPQAKDFFQKSEAVRRKGSKPSP